ncbi:hypothetical protein Tco_0513901 [Tanacetum coccineum]
MAPTTRRGPNTPVNNTNPNNMTPESIQAMIDQALLRNSTNGDGSHSGEGDEVSNWTSSGVIGERVRVMSLMHFLELEVVEKLLEEEMLWLSNPL